MIKLRTYWRDGHGRNETRRTHYTRHTELATRHAELVTRHAELVSASPVNLRRLRVKPAITHCALHSVRNVTLGRSDVYIYEIYIPLGTAKPSTKSMCLSVEIRHPPARATFRQECYSTLL